MMIGTPRTLERSLCRTLSRLPWGVASLCLLLFTCGRVHAEDTPVPKELVPKDLVRVTVVLPPPYLLAADDALSIKVINFENLTTQLIVPPDGKIVVPLLDPLPVTGKTTEELRQMLIEKWRKYVINPSVSVTLVSKRRENILIYGRVARTGTVELRTGLRLVEALAEVGGTAPDAEPSKLTLTRKTGERLTLDVSKPETRGGTEVDVPLLAGDVIYVPERRTQIAILGEVNRPGNIDYRDDMTVLDALTAAGGVREMAELAGATLRRDGKEEKLDLEALLRRGDIAVNTRLKPGDRLMVPEIRNRTYVFGAVAAPGFYNFKPGDRILDALKGSGGPTREADLGRVSLVHIDRTKNTATVQAINVDKALKKGNLTGNVPIEAGDVLFVPDRRKGFGIQDMFGVLSGLNLVDSFARIFTKGLGSGR